MSWSYGGNETDGQYGASTGPDNTSAPTYCWVGRLSIWTAPGCCTPGSTNLLLLSLARNTPVESDTGFHNWSRWPQHKFTTWEKGLGTIGLLGQWWDGGIIHFVSFGAVSTMSTRAGTIHRSPDSILSRYLGADWICITIRYYNLLWFLLTFLTLDHGKKLNHTLLGTFTLENHLN